MMFLPALGGARLTEAVYITRSTMLNTAFALFKDGPDALDRPANRDAQPELVAISFTIARTIRGEWWSLTM